MLILIGQVEVEGGLTDGRSTNQASFEFDIWGAAQKLIEQFLCSCCDHRTNATLKLLILGFSQLTGVSMYFHPPEYNICSLTTVMKIWHVPAVWRVPYQAYGPFCSCSSPPGIASRSRSCRPWCCNCWRSPNPSAWPCSHPRAEAGTSAERDGGARAQPLRANCLLNIPSCVWRINAVIWPFCQHCEECINLSWGESRCAFI